MEEQKLAHIYALLEPGTRKPRYVGQSTNVPARRNKHWWGKFRQDRRERNPALADWLVSLNGKPEYFIFQAVPYELRHKAEHYYTELLRQVPGIELLNINSGAHLSAGHAAKFKAAGTAALTGRKQSLEERARRSGWTHTSESKAAIGAAHKGRPKSPEIRAKMTAARKAWWERKRAGEAA